MTILTPCNDAGVCDRKDFTSQGAKQKIGINYYGIHDICQMFLTEGKMKATPNARIVNLTSVASALSWYPAPMRFRFLALKTVSYIDARAHDYISAVESGTYQAARFGEKTISYAVSKGLFNALPRVLAKENPRVAVNCCCPGWMDSDMGKELGKALKTLEEGARIPLKLAIGDLGPGGDKNGGLCRTKWRMG